MSKKPGIFLFLLKARRTILFAVMGLLANAFESSSPSPQPAKSIRLAIAMSIFGGCNMLHAIWVFATAGREKKAMSNAWQKRAERIRNGSDDLFVCSNPDELPDSEGFCRLELKAADVCEFRAVKADVADVNQVGQERGNAKHD